MALAATKEIAMLERREGVTSEGTQTKQKLMRALDELRTGIAATERPLLERCRMSEGPARYPMYY